MEHRRYTDISIAILCGGSSSRFFGGKFGNKVFAPFEGKPLLLLVYEKFAGKSDDLFFQKTTKTEKRNSKCSL